VSYDVETVALASSGGGRSPDVGPISNRSTSNISTSNWR
jgi:hypothetical protein